MVSAKRLQLDIRETELGMSDLSIYLGNTYSKVIAIVGPAGSGKSTFCKEYPTVYELDSAFIGDSNFRKELLKHKSKDLNSYIDACTMQNWWNWNKAVDEIDKLTEMVTGIANMDSYHGKFVLINGAILSPGIASAADEIFYVHVPAEVRWKRLCERDGHKRSFTELMARFMITQFAESMHYINLFRNHANKIKVVDADFNFLPSFDLNIFKEPTYVPFPT